MCGTTIVSVNGKVGTFSFTIGVRWKTEPTLLEWAKRDFDACFAYLFAQKREDEAELLFEVLTRVTTR